MALTYHIYHNFGVRKLSMFEALHSNLPQDFANDAGVQKWMIEIKNDPFIKLTSTIFKHSNRAIRKTLYGVDRIANYSLLPFTYPISKVLPKPKLELEKCPFRPEKSISISGHGDLIIRHNNFFEQLQLQCKNIGASLETSKLFPVRIGYKFARFVLLLPFHFNLKNFSKEHYVLTNIDRYFPTFNGPDFCTWMEDSFLPVLLTYYISGKTAQMKEIADYGIVQERQVQVASEIANGNFIKSRLLSVSNVSIIDYEFKNNLPALSIKCSIDYIEYIVDKNGKAVVGFPDNIKRSDVLVQMIINTEESLPKWKAYEIRYSSVSSRI